MDVDRVRRLISVDFFVELAAVCHRLYRENPRIGAVDRMLAALKPPAFTQRVRELMAETSDLTEATAVFGWLHDELSPFMSESAAILSRPEMDDLHYRAHSEPRAAWHNLQVAQERWQLKRTLAESLRQHFPHWDAEAIEGRLDAIPPLVLLEEELSSIEAAIVKDLDLSFVLSFLRSSYLSWLGQDCGLEALATTTEHTGVHSEAKLPRGTGQLRSLLNARRPRYLEVSHAEFFREVEQQPPFRDEYAKVLRVLAGKVTDRHGCQDAIRSLTFRFSVPFAHSFVTSREFLETTSRKGVWSATANYYKVLDYISQIQRHLERFPNALGYSMTQILWGVPIVVELVGWVLKGTYATELYTSLDDGGSADDKEFDV